jgi:hypothetical protein
MVRGSAFFHAVVGDFIGIDDRHPQLPQPTRRLRLPARNAFQIETSQRSEPTEIEISFSLGVPPVRPMMRTRLMHTKMGTTIVQTARGPGQDKRAAPTTHRPARCWNIS